MNTQRCFNCHQWVQLVFVHSHYQCPVCGRNLLPCCEGETNCETEQELTINTGADKPKEH